MYRQRLNDVLFRFFDCDLTTVDDGETFNVGHSNDNNTLVFVVLFFGGASGINSFDKWLRWQAIYLSTLIMPCAQPTGSKGACETRVYTLLFRPLPFAMGNISPEGLHYPQKHRRRNKLSA